MFSRAAALVFVIWFSLGAFAGDQWHFRVGSEAGSLQSLQKKTLTRAHWLLQWESPEKLSEAKKALERRADILRFLPDDSFLVRVDSAEVVSLVADLGVRAARPYTAELKSAQPFEDLAKLYQVQFFTTRVGEVLLGFKNLRIFTLGQRSVILKANGKAIEKLAAHPEVEWVEEYRPMNHQLQKVSPEFHEAASDQLTGFETGTKLMGFEKAWHQGLKGARQIVAVADTGLDLGDSGRLLPDFKKRLVEGQAHGYFTESWADFRGHGTHVTGSFVGDGSSSQTLLKGGAYKAQFVFQSLWSESMEQLTLPAELNIVFDAARELGARVHNNSWGRDSQAVYDASSMQADEYAWEHPEFLMVFSAGNSGADKNRDGRIDEGSVGTPATAKNVLAVGASENYLLRGGVQAKLHQIDPGKWPVEPLASDRHSNNAKGIAAFSSRGPARDGRLKPEVVAPGTNIVSLCSRKSEAQALWGRFNREHCYAGGTSMAAPLVAAAATIVREHLQKNGQRKPTAALLKAVLMHTAEDLYPGQFGEVGASRGQEMLVAGPNNHQGYGRVNLSRAITKGLKVADNKTGLRQGESKLYRWRGVRKVTLVYHDPASSPAAAKNLVNDLQLEVELSDGRKLTSQSLLNNHEQISIPPEDVAKVRKISVFARRVAIGRQGRQPFSLVASQ